jgi:uncharacterized protein (DUF2132 family)
MHLHGNRLERYLARDIDERSLNVLDAHVANCFHCLDSITSTHSGTIRWERRGILGRLVALDDDIRVAEPRAVKHHAPRAEPATGI